MTYAGPSRVILLAVDDELAHAAMVLGASTE